MTATPHISTDGRSDYERIAQELRDLGLERYAGELDSRGYTVVPPELVVDAQSRDRYLDAVLRVAEQVDGTRPDLATGEPYTGLGHHGRSIGTLLGMDSTFEEVLMNPAILAFATWLCGYSCVLNAMTSLLKGPGGGELELHADAQIAAPVTGPLPPYPIVGNCTLALTDYTRENGCLAVVPGSHKWAVPATGPAAQLLENPSAVPVECPAGSLIVWHGNLWHGAYPRSASGLRVALTVYFARHWLRTQENWIDRISQEVLDRNPARFATLTGQAIRFGYSSPEEAAAFRKRAARFSPPRKAVNFADLPSLWG